MMVRIEQSWRARCARGLDCHLAFDTQIRLNNVNGARQHLVEITELSAHLLVLGPGRQESDRLQLRLERRQIRLDPVHLLNLPSQLQLLREQRCELPVRLVLQLHERFVEHVVQLFLHSCSVLRTEAVR